MTDLANSTSEQWQELWSLMAQLQTINPADLVSSHGGDQREDGFIKMSWTTFHPTVNRIEKLLYDLNVVQDFDWVQWRSEVDPDLVFNIERIQSGSLYDTVCLLTGIIRSKRFGSGVIGTSLRNDTFLALLNRLGFLFNVHVTG